ncbi:TetR/AcrR family transcriptional regulator [Ectobacillus panaciterrae]|uniref:TetR/AcrR family transcriptional regulator n=1 Tax=Ectobacillus panaciterrae TaxID=363872 RepID=UPI0003F4E89B|nr:TetR/AcrR family transcriptional regulator C-terminal ligand-binding domain-containing protein [Ectobacillus panaciterrae]
MTGKKKEPRSRNEILNATIEMLEFTSYSSLTIEAIASQAGVGKTTIYRWWENKAYLVLDAFLMVVDSKFEFNSNNPVQDTFKQHLEALARILNSKIGKSTLTIVIENEEIAKKFCTSYLSLRRSKAKQLLQAAIDKGEVQSTINADVVLDMLYGSIYFQILIYKKVPDEDYINELLTRVMKGISIPNQS